MREEEEGRVRKKLQESRDQVVALTIELEIKSQVVECLTSAGVLDRKEMDEHRKEMDEEERKGIDGEIKKISDGTVTSSRDGLKAGATNSHTVQFEAPFKKEPPTEGSKLVSTNQSSSLSLQDVQKLPIGQWRASHVVCWLEEEMEMGCYRDACLENIKSGKVVLLFVVCCCCCCCVVVVLLCCLSLLCLLLLLCCCCFVVVVLLLLLCCCCCVCCCVVLVVLLCFCVLLLLYFLCFVVVGLLYFCVLLLLRFCFFVGVYKNKCIFYFSIFTKF